MPSIKEAVAIDGVGTLNLESIERRGSTEGPEEVYLRFALTNASGGYDAKGTFDGYVVGDDGIVHRLGWGMSGYGSDFSPFYSVGPGQTGEVSMGFLAPSWVENLKLVLTDQDGRYIGPMSIPDRPQ